MQSGCLDRSARPRHSALKASQLARLARSPASTSVALLLAAPLQAAEADEQLVPLERRLTVDEILTCRHVAQRVLDASLAAASGMGEAMLVGGGLLVRWSSGCFRVC